MREAGHRRNGGLLKATVSGQAQEMLAAKGLLHILSDPLTSVLISGKERLRALGWKAYTVGRQVVERLLDMRCHERNCVWGSKIEYLPAEAITSTTTSAVWQMTSVDLQWVRLLRSQGFGGDPDRVEM